MHQGITNEAGRFQRRTRQGGIKLRNMERVCVCLFSLFPIVKVHLFLKKLAHSAAPIEVMLLKRFNREVFVLAPRCGKFWTCVYSRNPHIGHEGFQRCPCADKLRCQQSVVSPPSPNVNARVLVIVERVTHEYLNHPMLTAKETVASSVCMSYACIFNANIEVALHYFCVVHHRLFEDVERCLAEHQKVLRGRRGHRLRNRRQLMHALDIALERFKSPVQDFRFDRRDSNIELEVLCFSNKQIVLNRESRFRVIINHGSLSSSSPMPLSRPYGERPAPWWRNRLISDARDRHAPAGFDSPVLRSTCLGSLSGPEQAIPDPFRSGDASGLRSGFNGRPAFVVHSEISFGGLPGRWPAHTLGGFFVGFHVPSIWAPTKFAIPHFVCGQKVAELLGYTHQLGVMAQQKNPAIRRQSNHGAREHKSAFAGCVPNTCILAEAPRKANAMTARKDFRIVRDKFANDSGLPFGKLLSREYVLNVLESEGHYFRSLVFCPLVVLWGWLSQALSLDKSLNEAVSRILAHRVSVGLPACAATSSSYSEARIRFPEAAMIRMAKEIGRKVHDSADGSWKWRDREVFLVDGTGLTMADTPENQLEYPQVSSRPAGLGFPIMRTVAIISLSTGAVVDFGIAKHEGKGTGEGTLLRGMIGDIRPGSVLVADRLFPGYATVAALQKQGVELVSMSHHVRHVDFTQGHQLGPNDHIVEWHRSKYNGNANHGNYRAHQALPETITMREFEIEIDGREGGKEKVVIVTTLTDPSIPQKEISDLYWSRWNCELDIRSIKHALHMNVLRCKTPSMVRKEIFAHLLAYNLLRGTMTEAAKRKEIRPRQLSVKGTMQAVESFTAPMMAIDGNQAIYDAFLNTVSAHRVGNRPGRLEPRFKKSRPAWIAYMTKPRHKSHRRLASPT